MPRNKIFPGGVHVPSLTFFKDDARQEIDWELQEQHFKFLIESGLHGIVIAGSNGEAVTLSTSEKTTLVQLARKTATQLNRPDITITLGCSGQATRDVLDECHAAAAQSSTGDGADFVLILVPSYYSSAMDSQSIVEFFKEVADGSPLPVMVYNFPSVAGGLDVDSEMLVELSKHENISGVKLTCGSIGKVPRVVEAAKGGGDGDGDGEDRFAVLSGQIDWMGPAMGVGAVGAITGMANLHPRSCVELYNLYIANKIQEATAFQLKIATCEWAFAKGGINGSKWVVAKLLGYPESSSACRRPHPVFADQKKRDWIVQRAGLLLGVEAKLARHV